MEKKTPADALCTAAWNGDVQKIQSLLKKGASPGGVLQHYLDLHLERGFVYNPSPMLIVADKDPYPFFNRIQHPAEETYELDMN
jgi:hypothetical protein